MGVDATEGIKLTLGKKSLKRLEKIRTDNNMIIKGPKNLLSPQEERKYEGKFVAISNGPRKKVIAAADSYSALIKAAREKAKNAFSVIAVPKEGVLYSH